MNTSAGSRQTVAGLYGSRLYPLSGTRLASLKCSAAELYQSRDDRTAVASESGRRTVAAI